MEIKFPDGDRIYEDPRRDDRLICYVPKSGWSRAIGLLPDYDPHATYPRSVRFWKDHLARLESMSDFDLVHIIEKYAQTIEEFTGWKTLNVEFPDWLVARVGEDRILQSFVDAGWQLQSKDLHSYRWSRA